MSVVFYFCIYMKPDVVPVPPRVDKTYAFRAGY